MSIGLHEDLRNNRLDEITPYIGTSAILRIYTASYAILLAELVCNASAFAADATGGVLTLNAITSDSDSNNTGTPALARIYKSDGTTIVISGLSVGTGSENIILDKSTITAGTVTSITSGTITDGNA